MTQTSHLLHHSFGGEAGSSPLSPQATAVTDVSKESKKPDMVPKHKDTIKSVVATSPTMTQTPHLLPPFTEASGENSVTMERDYSTSARTAAACTIPLDNLGSGPTTRRPQRLTPENILRTARSMASSCDERELVAVQVQQSAESVIRSTVAVTRKGPHTLLPSSCATVGLGASSALVISTSGCVNALRVQLSPGRAPASPAPGCDNVLRIQISPRRAPASPTLGCVNALRTKLSPRRAPVSSTSGCVNALTIKLFPGRAQSPEHKRHLGEKKSGTALLRRPVSSHPLARVRWSHSVVPRARRRGGPEWV